MIKFLPKNVNILKKEKELTDSLASVLMSNIDRLELLKSLHLTKSRIYADTLGKRCRWELISKCVMLVFSFGRHSNSKTRWILLYEILKKTSRTKIYLHFLEIKWNIKSAQWDWWKQTEDVSKSYLTWIKVLTHCEYQISDWWHVGLSCWNSVTYFNATDIVISIEFYQMAECLFCNTVDFLIQDHPLQLSQLQIFV